MTETRNPFTMPDADIGAELERAHKGLTFVLDLHQKAPDLLSPGALLAIGEHCGALADACETAAHDARVLNYAQLR